MTGQLSAGSSTITHHAPVPGKPRLIPRTPFASLSVPPTMDCGVIVSDRDGLGIASVHVRKGKRAGLAQQVHTRFCIELPNAPHRTSVGDVAFLGIGPDKWLATRENGGNAFSRSLCETLGEFAAVTDQSDGYAVLHLLGPKVKDALCKLLPIDIHPCAFGVGDIAVTVAAHMPATLWRLEDAADGSSTFEIGVSRSLADTFWHALSESAAEFGLVVARPADDPA